MANYHKNTIPACRDSAILHFSFYVLHSSVKKLAFPRKVWYNTRQTQEGLPGGKYGDMDFDNRYGEFHRVMSHDPRETSDERRNKEWRKIHRATIHGRPATSDEIWSGKKQSQNKAKQSQFSGPQTLILAQKWGFSTILEQPFYAKQSQIIKSAF
jgi:hypothetical protein